MPRVSVVVPNYNHERYLARRVRSILAQTFQDFELILLDDASTDGSVRVLELFSDDPRVRIVVNDTNSGSPFPQWNRGVELAQCEYVWIAEADDDADPRLLETLVKALDEDPATVLAYCQSWVVDESDRPLRTMLYWTGDLDTDRWKHDFRANGTEEVRRYLLLKNTIPNASAVVFRRAAYRAAGGAPTHLRLCGDWITWASMAMQGGIAFVSTPLNRFRHHETNVRSSTSARDLLRETFEVVVALESRVGIPDDLRARLASRMLTAWRVEYWREPAAIEMRRIGRMSAYLWRLNRWAATKFFLFFLQHKMLGKWLVQPLRRLWRVVKRTSGAIPA